MCSARIDPNQEQIRNLLKHYRGGKLSKAEKVAISITQEFPKNQFGWLMLGAILARSEKHTEALTALKKAVSLSPKDARALNNLGVTLKKLQRFEEAEISFRQAIALKPDYAEAYNNLGNTFQSINSFERAKECYLKAVQLKSDFAQAYNNLSVTLKKLGRLDEACFACAKALNLNKNFTGAYINLSHIIMNFDVKNSKPNLYPALLNLLQISSVVRPTKLAPSICTLLKHDTQIKDLIAKKNSFRNLKTVTSIIETLHQFQLLHHLLRICPLPDLELEEFFTKMRRFILVNIDNIAPFPELIYFLSTLCIHCFTNEYVYFESDEETHLIGKLQANISQIVAQSEQPEALKVLCLASYRSLHQYDWCQKLESLDNLKEVKERLIEEPLLEKVIAQDIPVLEEISDDVSLKVRKQYEENPYPRWVKLETMIKAKPIVTVCDESKLQLYSKNIKNVTAPAILIAGCGTGQHSTGTASRFSNCHVTAVDLSLASLAYAQRKSNELCFTNIDYLQADILHLHQIGKEFDIIESMGVLHHMDEPMAGWKVLVDLLKPGGLMRIGLYSEFARHHIVEIRKEIAALGLETSEADIRKFRQSLAESHDEHHQLLTMSNDFFSLSTLRDLIFHVQEHRFTLPQIKNCLNELGLKFCGFENKRVISNFRKLHGKESDIYDLELWHQYEERNPRAFAGMYQFWCQKS